MNIMLIARLAKRSSFKWLDNMELLEKLITNIQQFLLAVHDWLIEQPFVETDTEIIRYALNHDNEI